jgi:hypothetical protein
MKGVFNQRTPTSKYTQTWDVNLVLDYFRTLPLGSISLKDLTIKLCMLMALTSAQRCQTLHFLDIDHMSRDREGAYIFNLPEHVKHSRPNYKVAPLVFHPFDEDNLSVIKTLETYLLRTSQIRNNSRLFLSYIKPHKSVSTDTIGRWLKICMAKSGVNISLYKPHSTRSASVSKVNAKAVPIETIMSHVGWSSPSTFTKFYNMPIVQNFLVSCIMLIILYITDTFNVDFLYVLHAILIESIK